jgi:hypothetical protein
MLKRVSDIEKIYKYLITSPERRMKYDDVN